MKDDKARKDYNKLVATINRKYMKAPDTEQVVSRAKLESDKPKVILSNIFDPHTQFNKGIAAPTGRHVVKKLAKKPLDNFKLNNGRANTTSYKTLMMKTGTTSEIVNSQRRHRMYKDDDVFSIKKKTNIASYGYKRIM